MLITIDGPVASGKSTIARMLAHRLNYYYIYSGLLYRGYAYAALDNNVDMATISEQTVRTLRTMLAYVYDTQEHIRYQGKDITDLLFSPVIDHAASCISMVPLIREYVNKWQRELAQMHDVIIDGRDSGSVVFQDADLKIYLDSPLPIRVERWHEKQHKLGNNITLQAAADCVEQRDGRDMQRPVAPLVIPNDAIVLSNIGSLEETIKRIIELVPSQYV